MDYTKKIVVLAQEDPSQLVFNRTCDALGVIGIDPLSFINPESHTLVNIYKDMFKEELANQLMGYLVQRQKTLLVWDVINAVHQSQEDTVVINVTLLTAEDVNFITDTLEHVLTYEMQGSPLNCARNIYQGVKTYKDSKGI